MICVNIRRPHWGLGLAQWLSLTSYIELPSRPPKAYVRTVFITLQAVAVITIPLTALGFIWPVELTIDSLFDALDELIEEGLYLAAGLGALPLTLLASSRYSWPVRIASPIIYVGVILFGPQVVAHLYRYNLCAHIADGSWAI